MQSKIGETAGQVYKALESDGPMTLTGLKTAIKTTPFLLNAAIGWLAREDKIHISQKGRSQIITLK